MKKSQIPSYLRQILNQKRNQWVREMAVDKFSTVEIGFVFNLTKSRISQIIHKKERN